MGQTSVVAAKILAALQANDNAAIPALLMEMKAVRSTGHAEFLQ